MALDNREGITMKQTGNRGERENLWKAQSRASGIWHRDQRAGETRDTKCDEKEKWDKWVDCIRAVVEVIARNGRDVRHEIQLIYLCLRILIVLGVTERVVQLGQLRATILVCHGIFRVKRGYSQLCDDVTFDLSIECDETGAGKTYIFTVAGIEKKAAVERGGVSGVVDLTIWWRNGDDKPTGDPTAPGITPPRYIIPGETGIKAGAGVRCIACPGL